MFTDAVGSEQMGALTCLEDGDRPSVTAIGDAENDAHVLGGLALVRAKRASKCGSPNPSSASLSNVRRFSTRGSTPKRGTGT